MKSSKILAVSVEVVTFLFAAFGGFLQGIAPPDDADARFAVGLGSILALGILLWIAAAKRSWFQGRRRNAWLAVAASCLVLAVVVGTVYWHQRSQRTFPFPPEQAEPLYVAGTELTEVGKDFVDEHGDTMTISEIVDAFGGPANRELLWTHASIGRARMLLIVLYLLSVLTVATGIFSLTEGILAKNARKPRRQDSEKPYESVSP